MKHQMGFDKRILKNYKPVKNSIADTIFNYAGKSGLSEILEDLKLGKFLLYGFLAKDMSLSNWLTSYHEDIGALYILQGTDVNPVNVKDFVLSKRLELEQYCLEFSTSSNIGIDINRLNDYLSEFIKLITVNINPIVDSQHQQQQ